MSQCCSPDTEIDWDHLSKLKLCKRVGWNEELELFSRLAFTWGTKPLTFDLRILTAGSFSHSYLCLTPITPVDIHQQIGIYKKTRKWQWRGCLGNGPLLKTIVKDIQPSRPYSRVFLNPGLQVHLLQSRHDPSGGQVRFALFQVMKHACDINFINGYKDPYCVLESFDSESHRYSTKIHAHVILTLLDVYRAIVQTKARFGSMGTFSSTCKTFAQNLFDRLVAKSQEIRYVKPRFYWRLDYEEACFPLSKGLPRPMGVDRDDTYTCHGPIADKPPAASYDALWMRKHHLESLYHILHSKIATK